MNDELKAKRELQRAEEAKQVLNNKLYQEAFTALRANLVDKFQNTKFKEVEERNEIWRRMKTVDHIESYLARAIKTGKMAEGTLSILDKAKNLMR